MKSVNEKTFLDKVCFRCCKCSPKHDVKNSIRKNTFLENIRINMIALYFLIFDCFINNLSANKAFIEFKNFKNKYIEIMYHFQIYKNYLEYSEIK